MESNNGIPHSGIRRSLGEESEQTHFGTFPPLNAPAEPCAESPCHFPGHRLSDASRIFSLYSPCLLAMSQYILLFKPTFLCDERCQDTIMLFASLPRRSLRSLVATTARVAVSRLLECLPRISSIHDVVTCGSHRTRLHRRIWTYATIAATVSFEMAEPFFVTPKRSSADFSPEIGAPFALQLRHDQSALPNGGKKRRLFRMNYCPELSAREPQISNATDRNIEVWIHSAADRPSPILPSISN